MTVLELAAKKGPLGLLFGMTTMRLWPATKRETVSHFWLWDHTGKVLSSSDDRPTKYVL